VPVAVATVEVVPEPVEAPAEIVEPAITEPAESIETTEEDLQPESAAPTEPDPASPEEPVPGTSTDGSW
jgi:hypothetical protein